ncbi:MAG: AIR carboxylase family protein, partial [Gemmatimonadaceae bacterium]|nr:AIR carboxylase family protein [Gemmatimonadaceae bacterium]
DRQPSEVGSGAYARLVGGYLDVAEFLASRCRYSLVCGKVARLRERVEVRLRDDVHDFVARAPCVGRSAVGDRVSGARGSGDVLEVGRVVGGLVAVPVIAVPTSVGYGASFGGIAALLSMLNSCAAGVTVVNIDNGFGAAYAASRIIHR